MLLSGAESDESDPVHVHYGHVLDGNPLLALLAMRKAGYALWSFLDERWLTFGPMTDGEIDRALSDGTVDREQGRLQG